MSESRDQAVTALLSPEQVAHLQKLVARGQAASPEDAIARLIDRDRLSSGPADRTPLDGLFGKPPADDDDRGESMWDRL